MALAAFHMGATYVKEGRYDEALPYLDAARQQQPDFPDTYVFLGYAYANTGRIQQGIDSLNEFLKLRPDAQQSPKIEEQVEKLRAMLGQTSGEPGIPEGAVPFGTITVGPSGKPVAPEAPKQ
jgi:tetratricopeptide (TPR) repeat protein